MCRDDEPVVVGAVKDASAVFDTRKRRLNARLGTSLKEFKTEVLDEVDSVGVAVACVYVGRDEGLDDGDSDGDAVAGDADGLDAGIDEGDPAGEADAGEADGLEEGK